jgi:hypothetical protein
MKSRTTARFRRTLASLPERVQRDAKLAYQRFRDDPLRPGLDFKLVNPRRRRYSVRIGIHYRALGVREGDDITWYWIGTHDEYERLIS